MKEKTLRKKKNKKKRQKWYEMEWAQKYSQTCSHKYWGASKKKKKEMREKYHQYL